MIVFGTKNETGLWSGQSVTLTCCSSLYTVKLPLQQEQGSPSQIYCPNTELTSMSFLGSKHIISITDTAVNNMFKLSLLTLGILGATAIEKYFSSLPRLTTAFTNFDI